MRVLIAGGGTGGHLFPAVAMAEAFLAADGENRVVFVGTDSPLEIRVLAEKGYPHEALAVEGLKGRGIWRQMRALAKIPGAVHQARAIVSCFRPDIVMGVGGYSSGPVALAARMMGKRLVIHEQNRFPGLANRLAGRFADRIFVSFPDDDGVFPVRKVVLTGNPVRRDLLSVKGKTVAKDTFCLLIVGGSQGARAINKSMVEALDCLVAPDKISFVHQTGRQDEDWVKGAYEKRGLAATVRAFFSDMAQAYGMADLVICRAGATTVAELTALGKPAVFIPFPFAANNHQELNARYVSQTGGGEVILERDLTGRKLAQRIEALAGDPAKLAAMAQRALTLGQPQAAERIVAECVRLVNSEQ